MRCVVADAAKVRMHHYREALQIVEACARQALLYGRPRLARLYVEKMVPMLADPRRWPSVKGERSDTMHLRIHRVTTGMVLFNEDVDHVCVATFPAREGVFIEGMGVLHIGVPDGARLSQHKRTLRIDLDRPASLLARLRQRFSDDDSAGRPLRGLDVCSPPPRG